MHGQALLEHGVLFKCAHFTVLVARYGILAHAVRPGRGLRVCVLAHLHSCMVGRARTHTMQTHPHKRAHHARTQPLAPDQVERELVAAVRAGLDAQAAAGGVAPAERELLEPFVDAAEAFGRTENITGKTRVRLDEVNYANPLDGKRAAWRKPVGRTEMELIASKGGGGQALREKWLGLARERVDRDDLSLVSEAVDLDHQLLGLLLDPILLVAMCEDLLDEADATWTQRCLELVRLLQATLPPPEELAETPGPSRRSGRGRGEDGDHAAGLRAAAWALDQAEKCNFRGASWAAKSRAKAKAAFSG